MSDSKVYRIFVVNPGSTSTKVEFFENEKSILEGNVFHDSAILKNFPTINDQLDYRMQVIDLFMKENHIDLTGLDAVVGRGGPSFSMPGGIYEIDERLIAEAEAFGVRKKKKRIIEIKTHKYSEETWKTPKEYFWQVWVQMFATGKRDACIYAYAMKEEDYENFFLPIDDKRIEEIPVEYNADWIAHDYLPRLVYLCKCLKQRKTPNYDEFIKTKAKND